MVWICAGCLAEFEEERPTFCSSCGVSGMTVPKPSRVGVVKHSRPRPLPDVLSSSVRRGVLPAEWSERLGAWPSSVLCLLYGRPGSGKSTLATKIAGALAREGRRVLYAASEEGFSASLRDRFERCEVRDDGIDIDSSSSGAGIVQEASSRRYQALVVDSVTAAHLKPYQLAMIQQERGIPVIGVLQVTKDGRAAGDAGFEHLADVVVRVEAGTATPTKNRYGGLNPFPVFEEDPCHIQG